MEVDGSTEDAIAKIQAKSDELSKAFFFHTPAVLMAKGSQEAPQGC